MKSETTTAAEPAKLSKIILTVLVGILVGLAFSIIILLIFSLIITVKDIPQGAIPTLSAVSVALGCFAGGLTGAKLHRKSGLAVGILIGFLIYLLLLFAGTLAHGDGLSASTLIKLVVSVASGGIGGIIGVNTRKN